MKYTHTNKINIINISVFFIVMFIASTLRCWAFTDAERFEFVQYGVWRQVCDKLETQRIAQEVRTTIGEAEYFAIYGPCKVQSTLQKAKYPLLTLAVLGGTYYREKIQEGVNWLVDFCKANPSLCLGPGIAIVGAGAGGIASYNYFSIDTTALSETCGKHFNYWSNQPDRAMDIINQHWEAIKNAYIRIEELDPQDTPKFALFSLLAGCVDLTRSDFERVIEEEHRRHPFIRLGIFRHVCDNLNSKEIRENQELASDFCATFQHCRVFNPNFECRHPLAWYEYRFRDVSSGVTIASINTAALIASPLLWRSPYGKYLLFLISGVDAGMIVGYFLASDKKSGGAHLDDWLSIDRFKKREGKVTIADEHHWGKIWKAYTILDSTNKIYNDLLSYFTLMQEIHQQP